VKLAEDSRGVLLDLIEIHQTLEAEEDTELGPGRETVREGFWAQVSRIQGDPSHWDRYMIRVVGQAFRLEQVFTTDSLANSPSSWNS